MPQLAQTDRPQFTGPEGQEHMPYLLTPGPLTTSQGVKRAMLADWGSRDIEFRALVKEIRTSLHRLAGCNAEHECVIMQGSGTFAIEAALGSFCPAEGGKTLVNWDVAGDLVQRGYARGREEFDKLIAK